MKSLIHWLNHSKHVLKLKNSGKQLRCVKIIISTRSLQNQTLSSAKRFVSTRESFSTGKRINIQTKTVRIFNRAIRKTKRIFHRSGSTPKNYRLIHSLPFCMHQIEQTPSFREPSLVGKNQVPTSTTVKQQQFRYSPRLSYIHQPLDRKSTDRLRQPPQIRATNQHNNERHTSAKIKATPLPTSKNSHYKASTNIPANPYSLPAAFRSCEVGPPLHVPQKRHSFSYVM